MTAHVATRPSESRTLELSDGRTLGYHDLGDPSGAPIVMYVGMPAVPPQERWRASLHSLGEHARARIIVANRPGNGASSLARLRPEGYASDIHELTQSLGIDRYGVLSGSGGSRFAMAVAAWNAAEVVGLALLCPVAPLGRRRDRRLLPWRHRLRYWYLRSFPGHFARMHGPDRWEEDSRPPRVLGKQIQSRFEAFRSMDGTSVEAYLHEVRLIHEPWPELDLIECPVAVWYGGRDQETPPGLLERMAAGREWRLTKLPHADHRMVWASLISAIQFLAGHHGVAHGRLDEESHAALAAFSVLNPGFRLHAWSFAGTGWIKPNPNDVVYFWPVRGRLKAQIEGRTEQVLPGDLLVVPHTQKIDLSGDVIGWMIDDSEDPHPPVAQVRRPGAPPVVSEDDRLAACVTQISAPVSRGHRADQLVGSDTDKCEVYLALDPVDRGLTSMPPCGELHTWSDTGDPHEVRVDHLAPGDIAVIPPGVAHRAADLFAAVITLRPV